MRPGQAGKGRTQCRTELSAPAQRQVILRLPGCLAWIMSICIPECKRGKSPMDAGGQTNFRRVEYRAVLAPTLDTLVAPRREPQLF